MFIRMYRLLISIQWKWMNIVAVKLNFFFTKSTIYMTCTIFQSIGSHVILQNIIVFVQINKFWVHYCFSILTNLQYKTSTWVHSPLMVALQWVNAGDWTKVVTGKAQLEPNTHETIFIRPDLLSLSMWPHTEWQQRYTAHLWTWSRTSFHSIDPCLMVWSLILDQHKYTHQQTPQVSTTKLTRIIIFPTVKQKIRPWTRTSHIRRKQRLDNVFVEQNKLFSDYRFSATALMFGCIWRDKQTKRTRERNHIASSVKY